MRTVFFLLILSLSVLTGCARVPLNYEPTLNNIQALKNSSMAPVALGEFVLAPGKPKSLDQSVSARSVTVISPINDSFASYIRDAMSKELNSAGKLDPKSSIVISGLLTDNELDSSISNGHGVLGAKFAISRNGSKVFEKQYVEKAEWESSFVGAIAIPEAVNQYTALYKKLLTRLFGDEEFTKSAAGD